MATPAMRTQQLNIAVKPNNAFSVRLTTLAPDGSALDVSSGYTLESLGALPATDANVRVGLQEFAGGCSKAFDATGVTLSFTAAQATAIADALAVKNNKYIAFLSNDSGTTRQCSASGQLQLEDPGDVILASAF